MFGTRPEALKLAPMILAARKDPRFQTYVCLTAQHREMVDQVMKLFNLKPDFDLDLMQKGQTLGDITHRLFQRIDPIFKKTSPDAVIVQGDTTTAFATALKAFYDKLKVVHVEAGLRSFNKYHPFPEEINRVMISRLADFHFAPTQESYQNLLKEGVSKNQSFITGNTVVDALVQIRPRLSSVKLPVSLKSLSGKRIILMTAHRRENFGAPMKSICKAVQILCRKFPDVRVIYPVHLNPQVQNTVYPMLAKEPGVILLAPLSYEQFTALMAKSYLLLTDSGGVQEEAPSFHKPVLVMRETTERPDGVKMGVARLVGASSQKIVKEAALLLTNKTAYQKMTRAKNPYGDGKASLRILNILAKKLS